MRYLLSGIAILAACGNDNAHHLADSAVDSPTVDATPDGPSEGLVSLTVTSDGAVAGVTVHFQNADGTLVATVPTDANGTASATMKSGGFVTAVEPLNPDELFTFAGVRIGDALLLDLPNPPPTITVNVSAPLDLSASRTLLYTNCGAADITQASGSSTGPVAVGLTACGATTDMVVESRDVNFVPLQALFEPDVAVTDGATVTLTNSYQPLVTSSLSLTGFPATASSVTVSQGLATARGIVVDTFQHSTGILLTSGAGTGSLALPDVTGAIGIESVQLTLDSNGQRTVLTWGPFNSSFTLDGATLLSPYASSPVWDPTTNAVTYTLGAGGATADFEITRVDINDPTAGLNWSWSLVSPHGTTLAFPHIPAGSRDFNPTATDNINVSQLTSAKVPGGYDAVRAAIFDTGVNPTITGAGQASIQDLPNVALIRRPARTPQVWRERAGLGRPSPR